MKLVYLIASLLFLGLTATAQISTDSVLRANHIPTLDMLIDSAILHSPLRGYQRERQAEAQSLVRSSRREWTQYVGMEAYYRYGHLGVIDVNSPQTAGGTTPLPITTNSTQSQSWWYVGAFVRIPVFAIVDRANEVKRLKHTVVQSEFLMEDASQAIVLRVIEEYNTLLLNLDILIIKSLLLETSNAQVVEAENEYKSGKINLGRLAQLQEMQAKTATEYATARAECRTALLKLEQMTGIKLRLSSQY